MQRRTERGREGCLPESYERIPAVVRTLLYLLKGSEKSYSGSLYFLDINNRHWNTPWVENGSNFDILRFDANRDSIDTNPMAGHASGIDIHPYNIALAMLIAF